jgi:hypothetical protein
VSNNRYRLGQAIGSGTRPHLDGGRLGIAVLNPPGERPDGAPASRFGIEQWTDQRFRIEAEEPVPDGIDGEAVMLEPPLRFRSLAGVLRVRIAPGHPGASPSAAIPDSLGDAISALMSLVLARG